MSTSRKVYVVISTNEYSNSAFDIKAHGAFTLYQSANTKRGKVQKELDKSTSLGWQVWIEECELIQEGAR